ncbi:uncharacterized protein RCH25_044188 [Pelodytes ibericus]
MPRGELWLPEELKVLFKVVQDSCDLDILMSSRHANAVEWEPVALEMMRYGFRRTWQQCRAKWKALRRAFHLENEYKILHGMHSDKRPPSYSIMLKMWQKAGRPVFRDQHMLRNRKTRLQMTSRSSERSHAFYSIGHDNNVAQDHSLCCGMLVPIEFETAPPLLAVAASSDAAPMPEMYLEDEVCKPIILDHDIGSPNSNADSVSALCEEGVLFSRTTEDLTFLNPPVTGQVQDGLQGEEDIKPVVLHHIPETSRSDTESSDGKCQELQLLEKLVMQQKEIITRLDYLNHNLVQMASMHYQNMGDSMPDSVKTSGQDFAFSRNHPVSFPSMFIPFPTPMSAESYTTYISAPQPPPATHMRSSQNPSSTDTSFQIPADYIPSSQPSTAYSPSSLYLPSPKIASSLVPSFSPQSTTQPSSNTLAKKQSDKIY